MDAITDELDRCYWNLAIQILNRARLDCERGSMHYALDGLAFLHSEWAVILATYVLDGRADPEDALGTLIERCWTQVQERYQVAPDKIREM